MIISHKHKFIFIKPHKTAGTSVELLLSRICGINDIITPFGFDPDPKVRLKNNAKSPQNYFRKKPFKHWQIKEVYYFVFKNIKINNNYWEHQTADEIRKNIGDDTWNSYKKVSIVRNPWDQALSWFKWLEFRNNKRIIKGNFEHYLINHYRSAWPFYTINNGLYDIDYMIRFENLQEDLTSFLKQLDIEFAYELPKTKNNIRKKRDYKDFYTKANMIEIVNEKALNIIHKFNYKY
jgi:hypothetical protein